MYSGCHMLTAHAGSVGRSTCADCDRLPAVSIRARHALFQVAGGQADPEMQPHAHTQTHGCSS